MTKHIHTLYVPKEQASWSLKEGQVPHRYIQILTIFENGVVRDQTLELPEDEAYRLVASMGNVETLLSLIDPASGANLFDNGAATSIMTGTRWAMPGVATVLQALATMRTPDVPYHLSRVNISVDMRGGMFSVLDADGGDCRSIVVDWLQGMTDEAGWMRDSSQR